MPIRSFYILINLTLAHSKTCSVRIASSLGYSSYIGGIPRQGVGQGALERGQHGGDLLAELLADFHDALDNEADWRHPKAVVAQLDGGLPGAEVGRQARYPIGRHVHKRGSRRARRDLHVRPGRAAAALGVLRQLQLDQGQPPVSPMQI